MDAIRLLDPSFWTAPDPLAIGDPALTGTIANFRELAHHILFQTSGSSGTPKWIALSKTALLLSAATVNRHLRVTESSVWALSLPIHHVGGFGVAARAFEAACELARWSGKWDAPAFTRWLAEKRVTHLSLVPTQVHDLVAAGLCCPEDIRAIVVGGGRLSNETGRAARALGWPVLASYGMTETGSQIATQSLDLLETQYQHAPLPLLDPWHARTDPDGRLLVKGPALFCGTIVIENHRPIWHPREAEWYPTGDRALVENRLLTPLGRFDSVVKILGELVDPEAVERDLASLSGGLLIPGSFAIVAVPDARAGHRLVPVFSNALPRDAVASLLSRHAGAVPGFQRLSPPVWLDRLPTGDLGKIRRSELLRMIERLQGDETTRSG